MPHAVAQVREGREGISAFWGLDNLPSEQINFKKLLENRLKTSSVSGGGTLRPTETL